MKHGEKNQKHSTIYESKNTQQQFISTEQNILLRKQPVYKINTTEPAFQYDLY